MIKGVTKSAMVSVPECYKLLKDIDTLVLHLNRAIDAADKIAEEYGDASYILSNGVHVSLINKFDLSRVSILSQKLQSKTETIHHYLNLPENLLKKIEQK